MSPRVFLDCDGVLADFERGFLDLTGHQARAFEDAHGEAEFWRVIREHGRFFASLPLMADAMELYEGVKHLQPTILTGCPAAEPWVRPQKAAWTVQHFPRCPVVMCRSAEKAMFAKPGDVLIDDWDRYRDKWRAAGGIFIHHADASSSLDLLGALHPELRTGAA